MVIGVVEHDGFFTQCTNNETTWNLEDPLTQVSGEAGFKDIEEAGGSLNKNESSAVFQSEK